MDGIIVVNKPKGFTSHDIVNKIRKIYNTKKVGHTGTLDPEATGVLPILIGNATKLSNYLMEHDKEYIATIRLGERTNTGDSEGEVIETKDVPEISSSDLDKTVKLFIGKQIQTPPIYSAIKVNGKKLYEYARQGIEVERKEREIEIFDFSNMKLENSDLKFSVQCSKGTYVRTLCEDIAKKLGTCGTMTNLRRMQAGNFKIEDAISVDEISEEKIIPMEKLFDKKIDVKDCLKKLLNGEKIKVTVEDGLYHLYADEYLGIGTVSNGFLKREIIL